jgi:hypothetical protein
MDHPYGSTAHNVSTPRGNKVVPGTAKAVYHNGTKIGHVQSEGGYKDGPKIGGHVVAWRKDVVKHRITPTKESGIGNLPSYASGGHMTQADAIRRLIDHHRQVKK